MQRHFRRSFESLDEIFAFIERSFASAAIPRDLLNPVSFAVEELFTNMVKYNSAGPDEILLDLAPIDGGVTVSLVDYDSEPFDVTRAPPARTDLPLKDRKVGGLGLHLIKRMVDSLRYEYEDRRSTITFTRTIGKEDVRHQA